MSDFEKVMADCEVRQNEIVRFFETCENEEKRYEKIIELGRAALPLNDRYKVPENSVSGCQSVMHMHAWMEGDRVFFAAESEALISSGLAQLLIKVYSGMTPEVVLKCPPNYLEHLHLKAMLSPNRASGLYSIHLKMKQQALKLLVNK